MATKKEFDDLFAAIDAETTRIALKFEDILAKLAAGGLSATDEAAELAEGARLVAKLKGIAADATDPVPAPEPPAEGEPGTGTGGEGEPATPGEGETAG